MPRIELGNVYRPLADGTHADLEFIGLEGRRGTGKTRAILSCLMLDALKYPGARILLARSTRTRLSQSVLKTLEEQVFPAFGMAVPGGAGVDNRSAYKLPNGSELIPMGLDDQTRTQSVECAKIYVAEAVELSSQDDVLALAGAMRQDVRGIKHQCIVDCNPGPPGHWLNQIMEDVPKEWRRIDRRADYDRLLAHARRPPPPGRWKRLVTTHQDNPHYFDLPAWRFTEAGRKYLGTLSHLRGHLLRRWVEGQWVAAEGTVYPEFDEDRHVIAPRRLPADWPIYWGYDPGVDHPTAILWFQVSPNGTVYVIDEIHQGGQSIKAHADNVKARERAAGWQPRRRYGDPQEAFNRQKFSARTIASHWADEGIVMAPWPRTGNNSREMVEAVRSLIIADRLKVFGTCRNTINEFQSWSYRRSAKGEILPGDDAYEKIGEDALDVVKGVIAAGIANGVGRVRSA